MKEKIEYDLVLPLLRKIKTETNISPNEKTDEEIVFKDKKVDISVKYNPDKEEVEVKGEPGETILKELLKVEAENKKFFTEENIKNNPMSSLLTANYGGLKTNIKLFDAVTKILKDNKIKKVNIEISINEANELVKTPTLYINPTIGVANSYESGYNVRLSKLIFKTFPHELKNQEEIQTRIVGNCYYIRPIQGEQIIDITIKDAVVGKYYKDRNIIILFFNPFLLNKIYHFTEELPEIHTLLDKEFKRIGITKVSTEEMIKKNFITNFMGGVKSTLIQKEDEIKSIIRQIQDYDKRIVDNERQKILNQQTIEYLRGLLDTGGENMLNEIDEVEKLPFIEKYELKNNSLDLVFKPTFLKIKNFKRHSHNDGVGTRYIYVGQITASIRPDGIRISNPYNMINGHPHTHGNHDGTPCFGSGDAAKQIREFRIHNKFKELGTMLWFWINTHREDGAYIRMAQFYDDRLRQGYPILDEHGELIKFNDKERIKTGEQTDELEKHTNYEENIKNTKKYMEAFKK